MTTLRLEILECQAHEEIFRKKAFFWKCFHFMTMALISVLSGANGTVTQLLEDETAANWSVILSYFCTSLGLLTMYLKNEGLDHFYEKASQAYGQLAFRISEEKTLPLDIVSQRTQLMVQYGALNIHKIKQQMEWINKEDTALSPNGANPSYSE